MRKLIYLLFLIGATVLVSFRGGNISYMLFYFILILPVLAILYSLYVYFRFKIVQEVSRTVVKATEVPYRLILANEDPIPFTDITLHYYSDMVTIEECKETSNLSLLAYQDTKVETKMYCKYRGTYPVGVKSVSVTDFLGLFTITYPMMTQVRLTAKPRILPLELLKTEIQKKDPKNNIFSASKLQNLPDFEIRPYHPGDPLKYVHWKNSAKTGELLVRKQMPEELFETVIIMDLSPIEGDTEKRLQREDNVIEATLAFVHDYYMKQIPIRVVYMEDKNQLKEVLIDTRKNFDQFYDTCANLAFTSAAPLEAVMKEYARQTVHNYSMILITSAITEQLSLYLLSKHGAENEIVLINTEELSL